ncbi:MAG: translation initiation factor IF-2 [Pyrinomonadaceae bacterium]|nr:translation initiation factor IF-2 [Pyrinomonadaceae bacterium]MBP6214338.1 translation initiation factor IF-2 [Pyrinomonadaceae bacterium]
MAIRKSVRIYDLARELKQDTKRVMEDLRRAGADVSVASNSVSAEFAEKVRSKYFPKTEVAPKRAIKVIKARKEDEHAHDEVVEPVEIPEAVDVTEAAPVEDVELPKTVVAAEPDVEPVAEPLAAEPAPGVKVKKLVVSKVKAPVEEPKTVEPEPIVESVAPVEVIETATVVESETLEEEIVEAASEETTAPVVEAAEIEPAPKVSPSGTTVKTLTLTKSAIEKGIKPGDKLVSDAPTKTGRLLGDQRGNDPRRPQFRGTPGETAAPQMTYTPPADNRRRPGRGGGRKGKDDKGARFAERDQDAPRQRSIEERILDQVGGGEATELRSVRLTDGATVREFAEALGITPRDIVQLLIKRGVFATLNQPIGEKMAIEMAADYGFDLSFVPFEEMVIEQEFEELIAADADDVELPRAPVVTVMGHVDHGKTSLLDAIRSDNVAEGEAGGITQHIGAYSVMVPNADNPAEPRRVVFLDTPGHEAFTMMRARGAKATDIVILVVAADDGVMPQTIEAVEHSKAAGVPMIVAINKIDKPDANPDKVKQGLAGLGLQPTDWGGDTEMVAVSAKKRENLDTLLETVLLQADILALTASPTRRASGVVLEAKLDKGRGAVATALVQQGTLKVGDPFIVGQFYGKVRAMFSDRGESVTEASPATPVEILGLQGVPQAGDTFQVVSDIDRAQTIAGQRQMHARQAAMLKTTKRGIESLGMAEIKELLVILKADVQGSVEVLKGTLEKLSTDKVKVRVIRAGVGAIAESDVLLASATQADDASTAVVIIGFNVRPEARVGDIAKHEDVDIRLHSIIYKVEEEIKAAMIGMLDAIEKEVILGKAQIQDIFKVSKIGTIAGCRVTDGLIKRQAKARLIRDGVVVWTGDIASLKRFKDDTNEVKNGFECGISLVNFNDLKVGDEIEAFTIEKIAATEL